MQALKGANARLQAGEFASGERRLPLEVGAPLDDAADVGDVVVSARSGAPVSVRDVADGDRGFGERVDYVSHAAGGRRSASAVTMSVAKRKGANATHVAEQVLARVEQARAASCRATCRSR